MFKRRIAPVATPEISNQIPTTSPPTAQSNAHMTTISARTASIRNDNCRLTMIVGARTTGLAFTRKKLMKRSANFRLTLSVGANVNRRDQHRREHERLETGCPAVHECHPSSARSQPTDQRRGAGGAAVFPSHAQHGNLEFARRAVGRPLISFGVYGFTCGGPHRLLHPRPKESYESQRDKECDRQHDEHKHQEERAPQVSELVDAKATLEERAAPFGTQCVHVACLP